MEIKIPRLIGVVHLPPLVGSPLSHGEHSAELLHHAGLWAVKEAQTLVQAGFDGVILENFGDAPFYKSQVPAETIASLSVICAAVREAVQVPLGVNVLRNDARAALAIAAVTGCDFIRANVLSGVTATDQGLIEGDAANLLRERARLHAPVLIFADVHVKHGISLSSQDIGLAVEEVGLRALADAVILTGQTTGRLIESSAMQAASEVARAHQIPLYLGSGVTAERAQELKPWIDGVIVSSALRENGQAGAPLDPNRVKAMVRAFLKPKVKAKSKAKAQTKTKKKVKKKKLR